MNLGPGIIMDILAAAILLFSLLWGAWKGFAKTLVSFMQWFVCIIAGFFLCTPAKTYIIKYTTLDEAIHNYIIDQIETTIEESIPYQSIPNLFSGWLNTENADFIYGTAAALTNVLLTVVAFVAVILIIKIICGILVLFFSKEYHDGLIGFLDGFVGFLFGAVRGVLLLFLFFACLVPILSLLPGETSMAVNSALDQSILASVFYDNNILLILLRDLFS